MELNKTTQDLMTEHPHIQEVIEALNGHMKASQFSVVDISLIVTPEILPDITKLCSEEETIVVSLSLKLKQIYFGVDFTRHEETIKQIHNRKVIVGLKSDDDSFPVSFSEQKSELEMFEYFRTYHEKDGNGVPKWAVNMAARRIWDFFYRGTKPA